MSKLTIREGAYYRTRDGRKVGPMRAFHGDGFDVDANINPRDAGRAWWERNGLQGGGNGQEPLDLIAEWIDAPDLTAITTPYGLLDDATREALKAHGGPYERWDGGFWVTCGINPDWTRDVYRVKPQPPKPREWWCLLDAKRDKRIPFAWSTSREGAADMLGSDSAEIIHVREVTD